MKKIITVTLCIVLVLLFAGCGKNGDTSKVEIDYGASSIYSKEEIDSAIEIIKKQFALFEGCELHRLSYMTDNYVVKAAAYPYGETGLLYRPCVLQLHTEMLCPHRPENRKDNTSRCRTDGYVYPYV